MERKTNLRPNSVTRNPKFPEKSNRARMPFNMGPIVAGRHGGNWRAAGRAAGREKVELPSLHFATCAVSQPFRHLRK